MHFKKLIKLVIFCVTILVLKMEENLTFWAYHALLLKKGKNSTEMQKIKKEKICTVYGEGAVTDQMCEKCFTKFQARHFLLDDAPWWGRLVEVDNDQIKALTENNQHYITQKIAKILKMSK